MKPTAAEFVTAVVVAGLAALGGALAVFSGYDDAPGGTLIGLLMIAGAVVLGMWLPGRMRR